MTALLTTPVHHPDPDPEVPPVPAATSRTVLAAETVIGGVDTHKDLHVAAAIDGLGRVLGSRTFPTTPAGYRALTRWLATHGTIEAVGVEGTGSWGAGLARHLTDAGHTVIEVHRPNRQRRRLRGKTDTIDAEEAALAVISGRASAVPKTRTGPVEPIRMLRIARRGAMKARGQANNQLHSLIDTAPEPVRDQLRDLPARQRVALAARLRPGPDPADVTAAAKTAITSVARRIQNLDTEIAALDTGLTHLVTTTAPTLLARHGIGIDTAGALLVAAGDNPHRLRHEHSFAALCGTSPVEVSSGQRQRHRLNTGGDRIANSALWRIVIVQMATDPATRAYVTRRTTEGRTKKEIIRCLKRYTARQAYRAIRHDFASSSTAPDVGGGESPHGRQRGTQVTPRRTDNKAPSPPPGSLPAPATTVNA